jgi:NAD-dependent deacetylase
MNEKKIKEAAKAIIEKKSGIAFTGIPDFRSPTGVWAQYDIREYAYIDAFRENPVKVWDFFRLRAEEYSKARPNAGHEALAKLEEEGFLKAVVTQNIDLLHQRAGTKNIYELHGSMGKLLCLKCGKEYETEAKGYEIREEVPYCVCGKVLKPGVVFFGEALPAGVFEKSVEMALKTNFVIVAGTSAIVYPAAQIPYIAKRNGSFIIEVNQEPTGLTNSITDIFLEGKIQEILPRLAGEVEKAE